MKKKQTVISTYKLITTLLNKTISVTGNHPMYARKGSNEQFSNR